jgi:hypothetical protein
MRRWGKPEEFAGVAVYLASNASTFHNGDHIVLDGGYSMYLSSASPGADISRLGERRQSERNRLPLPLWPSAPIDKLGGGATLKLAQWWTALA